jgi:hypothetical protein
MAQRCLQAIVAGEPRERQGEYSLASAAWQVKPALGILQATRKATDVIENAGQFRPHSLQRLMKPLARRQGAAGQAFHGIVAHLPVTSAAAARVVIGGGDTL